MNENKVLRRGSPKFEVKDFNFWYKNHSKQALKNINLVIPYQKVTALIGPSGCGKSTLLRSFNRMNDLIDDTDSKGDILFDGKTIMGKNKNIISLRTKVGMVFQKPNPFSMSIYDNVAFGPKSHGIKSHKELNIIVKEALIDAALWDEVKTNLNDSALGLSGEDNNNVFV